MKKPFPPPHDILVELLIDARKAAKLTQADLAARLAVGQSAISKVERRVQHLDMVELYRWLKAIGGPSLTQIASLFEKRLHARIAAEAKWKEDQRAKRLAQKQAKGSK